MKIANLALTPTLNVTQTQTLSLIQTLILTQNLNHTLTIIYKIRVNVQMNAHSLLSYSLNAGMGVT